MTDHDVERQKRDHMAERLLAADLMGILVKSDATDAGQVDVLLDLARTIAKRLRNAAQLVADLKAEGCPSGYENGVLRCAYCEGHQINPDSHGEPEFQHTEMEDGQPCLWVRIESA